MCLFYLPCFFQQMELKRTWMKGKLDSRILVTRPDKQVILTTVHKDTEIDSFQSDNSVTLLVIGGNLKLHTRGELIILNEGQLHVLREKTIYGFTTRNEAVFLLTIVCECNRQKLE